MTCKSITDFYQLQPVSVQFRFLMNAVTAISANIPNQELHPLLLCGYSMFGGSVPPPGGSVPLPGDPVPPLSGSVPLPGDPVPPLDGGAVPLVGGNVALTVPPLAALLTVAAPATVKKFAGTPVNV